MKERLLLLAAISMILASCESGVDFSVPQSADHRFEQSREWNDANPFHEIVVQSDDYSVLFMADSHVGTTANLERVFSIAKASEASAVCIAGDLTSGDIKGYSAFEQSLPGEDDMLTFLTPGNHDLWDDNGWNEFYTRFGPSSYLFTINTPAGTDMYISLDSGSGTLGSRQLEWLENILKNQRSLCRHCIAFTHNDFLRVRHSEISNPLVEELSILIELFTKYHVDMLIAGHDHERNETMFGVTDYIIVGSVKDDDPDADYLQLRMQNGSIMYEFKDIN